MLGTFCVQILLNKKILSREVIFLLPSIVRESTDLDIVKKVLVDAEQNMGSFGSQVLSIHFFLVSASELTTNLLFILHSVC